MGEFVDSPMKPIGSMPSDYKGGPGKYNGQPGWPGRTPSPNAVPEKTFEEAMPGVQPPPPGKDGEQIGR